mmetsp:Transcript_10260/g.14136  ORF Transcript_10260/g.14136 Transcript_10260/m.14136 type:complete len:295 (-) Transcript_10260:341-1225(-)
MVYSSRSQPIGREEGRVASRGVDARHDVVDLVEYPEHDRRAHALVGCPLDGKDEADHQPVPQHPVPQTGKEPGEPLFLRDFLQAVDDPIVARVLAWGRRNVAHELDHLLLLGAHLLLLVDALLVAHPGEDVLGETGGRREQTAAPACGQDFHDLHAQALCILSSLSYLALGCGLSLLCRLPLFFLFAPLASNFNGLGGGLGCRAACLYRKVPFCRAVDLNLNIALPLEKQPCACYIQWRRQARGHHSRDGEEDEIRLVSDWRVRVVVQHEEDPHAPYDLWQVNKSQDGVYSQQL